MTTETRSPSVTDMPEGVVQTVELKTGRTVTVDETVKAKIVNIGGTVYRVGKRDKVTGRRVLRPLKPELA